MGFRITGVSPVLVARRSKAAIPASPDAARTGGTPVIQRSHRETRTP